MGLAISERSVKRRKLSRVTVSPGFHFLSRRHQLWSLKLFIYFFCVLYFPRFKNDLNDCSHPLWSCCFSLCARCRLARISNWFHGRRRWGCWGWGYVPFRRRIRRRRTIQPLSFPRLPRIFLVSLPACNLSSSNSAEHSFWPPRSSYVFWWWFLPSFLSLLVSCPPVVPVNSATVLGERGGGGGGGVRWPISVIKSVLRFSSWNQEFR